MTRIDRRYFVLGGLTAAGSLVLPSSALAAVPNPFQLGVASGDPATTSVVLWTRLAVKPLNADGHGGMGRADVPVQWQVATTAGFAKVVASGTATARYEDAHAIHVVARGLKPGTVYYYRFRARGHISQVGRTRTAPASGTFGPDLRIAVASCANYESGYYTAYRRMAEDRPDLVLFLGDYIYEESRSPGRVRTHAGGETVTLADYRRRYAQYRTDPDLRAAHAAAPWIVVPDDHEVENNYAKLTRANNRPVLSASKWRARQAAAYRAYYENMPLRSATFQRRVHWGRLATFHMLDTRRFRDDQACGDWWKVCDAADLPGRTITGAAQEKWLLDGLARHDGTWDVLGQQVFFAQFADEDGGANMDAWDGYRAARDRLQRGWLARGVRNPLVLTGDVHAAFANDLKLDYRDPGSATIGTELICTSISSNGDGTPLTEIPFARVNPHLRYFSERRGYTLVTLGRDRARADFRTLPVVTRRGARVATHASFVTEAGRPGLRRL
ncbi:alkaline phosphatase [Actinoplanes lobatus]|uniref:Alkaline phosphatase n=1 Tax=Actinoplanes lobatus TaxID=113568 RepID=A0A7W7HHD5_9ACTN|nr:alkaline phosphatase D family protein [Actinoplanes lobatus]MBB4750568.1 alkaline phosphatase D [Actinoplanes lobatus]GGN96756.1 alkaline phosphatase [Actinoplanes lobatus]GIE45497.1 alkaline phosphatase [Actinoplanes lobatus]